ncbi:MAG TPA: zincin-like metallopeptidase domain-containing protein, partial [Stellaceae bacterium]
VMVCAELGIGECEFTNGAAYIASWLETLRSDRKEIFRAATDAQRIADYLLALHPDYAARHLDNDDPGGRGTGSNKRAAGQ